jgi:N-acetylglucosamine-6-phosphate deacetylase
VTSSGSENYEDIIFRVEVKLWGIIRFAKQTCPARVISATDKGEIVTGYKTDPVIFSKDFEVKNICIDEVVYQVTQVAGYLRFPEYRTRTAFA